MPETSGLEVLTWVRTSPEFGRLPVVMFTSSTQHSDIAYCRKHGANAYLVKPSNAEHLSLLIKEVLAAAAELAGPTALLPLPGNQLIRSQT